MNRLAKFGLLITVLALILSMPVRSSAEPPSHAGGYQGYYRGSYSCLHYWLPRLYTCRAYHSESPLYDSPPYDQFPPSHSWLRHSDCGGPASPSSSTDSGHIEPKKD
jgi:hypothetical protein